MSILILSERLQAKLNETVEDATGFVKHNHSASLDEIRFHQGRISGLEQAAELLHEAIKEMY